MGNLAVRYAPRRETLISKQNGGFSFVEILLTVAIIVVLLSLSMVAVAQWIDALKITELDNAAREIYMAAENRSVLLQSSGAAAARLSLSASPGDGDLTPSSVSVTLDDGTTKNVSLCVLSDSTKTDILDDLLPKGVIEPTLWNGHFYVLYDESTQHVFEVFYAEKTFTQATLEEVRDLSRSERIDYYHANIASRCLVGHYDGGLVNRKNLIPLPKPIVEVNIENGNELLLTVKYTIPSELNGINIKREPTVTLEYKGTEVPLLSVNSSTGTVISPFYKRLTCNEDITGVTQPMSAEYTWVLDSLLTASDDSSMQFKDLDSFTSKLGGDFTVVAGLKLSGEGYIDSYNDGKATNNSLFAAASSDTDTAYIENLRHLQNLDMAFSEVGEKTRAEQLANINASEVKNYEGDVLEPGYAFKPIYNSALRLFEGGNNTISNLKVTAASAAGKDGAGLFSVMEGESADKKFEMNNVILEKPDVSGHDYAGALAGYSNFVKLKNCELKAAKVNGNVRSGGMIGYWWGSAEITECRVEDVEVKGGTESAGGIVGHGENSMFTKCAAEKVIIDNSNYAGGLVGQGVSATFTDCAVEEVSVKSMSHAGGLAGNMVANFSFENCWAVNTNVNSTGGVVGGLAGYTWSGTISFKNCGVETLTMMANNYAGGLMGSGGGASSLLFADCIVGQSDKVEITGTQAGGLLGNADGYAKLTGCIVGKSGVVESDKKIIVTGSVYAGGLVGNSGYKNNEFSNCRASNAKVTGNGNSSEAGGLVGRATEAFFDDCTANYIVVEGITNAGGLLGGAIDVNMGNNQPCIAENVTVTAKGNPTISIQGSAGGVVGNSVGGKFENCKAINAKVTADSEAGGLAGKTNNTNLRGCQVYWSKPDLLNGKEDYQVTAVTSGGLVGAVRNGGLIESSFAATLVKGTLYAGGLVGYLPSPDSTKGESSNVNIRKSYADCYLQVSHDTNFQYVGGLIGAKNPYVILRLQDVYAAGFIGVVGQGQAAGLCGGWVAPENKDELKAENAYAAIHYNSPVAGYPLACTFDYGCMTNCQFLESNRGWSNDYYTICNLPMGEAFEKKSGDDSHPYHLDYQERFAYPFQGLKGLPHYGDWPTK